jgi:hypothetical protein
MSAPSEAIGRLVITPRALADYRQMFDLSEADLLRGPILDCPGGASPFGAQVRARGGSVVSVDPAYGLPPETLMAQVRDDLARVADWLRAQDGTINWEHVGSPESQRRTFELGADLFAIDYAAQWPDDTRYVAASLPDLPFGDRHFSLAVCSHLLFVYPEYLDFDAHVASLLELVRVTDGEVRVFPLIDTTSTVYPRLADIRAALAEHGVASELRPARCMWQYGGDQLFVCRRA